MAFDLKTAKPVGGFDLKTARPVGAPEEAPQPEGDGALKNIAGGILEPIAQMGSAMVATPAAGLAGIAASVVPGANAADVVNAVQEKLTYQPKTEGGKAVSGAVAKPFEWVAGKAKDAGNMTLDLTGSPELATGVETAINMLPALILKGAPKAIKAVRATAHTEAGAETAAVAAAQKAGLNWEKLPGQVQRQIIQVAEKSKALDQLPPEALAREARMASHPAPITPLRGQATRDPVQMGLEKDVSQTDSGRPLRQRMLEQNEQLTKNLEIIRGRTGARVPEGASEAAGNVIQTAAREKLAGAEAQVRSLYKQAEAKGEMNARVDVAPIVDHYLKAVDPAEIDYAKGYLQRANVIKVGPDGEINIRRPASLKEMEKLRQQAITVARTDHSSKGHAAGKLVGVIDSIMDKTEAGPAYTAARAARRALGNEFERQGAVRDLVGQKAGASDRSVALEDTFKKTVLGGSIQDLRNVQSTLMAGQKGTRAVGRRAMKELAGQTIDYIKAEATRGVATMENGRPTFSAAGFVNAVEKKIGRAKLELLVGKTATDELFKLTQTARDLLTEPPSRAVGSITFNKILRWMDQHASSVPIAGPLASGGAKLAGMAYRAGKAGSDTRAALQTPLQEALARKPQVAYRLADFAGRNAERGAKVALPYTAAEAQQRR